MFLSKDQHVRSEAAFVRIIDDLSRRVDSLDDRQRAILADSLRYRAEVLLDTKHPDIATADINQLIRVKPDYSPGPDASSDVIALIHDIQASKVGHLSVSVSPEDAAIEVDGRTLAGGGQRQLTLMTGSHLITVVRDGYVSKVENVSIGASEPAAVRIVLAPVAATVRQGHLRIQKIRPSSAEVIVDGRSTGGGDNDLLLSVGNHSVRVHHDGYEDYTRTVSIQENAPYTLTADLRKTQIYHPRHINWAPRILTVRLGTAIDYATDEFKVNSFLTDSTYTWQSPAGIGTELGATVRVPRTPFSFGVTNLTTSTKFNAAFKTTTDQGNAQGLHRSQEGQHFEVGFSIGGDKAEFAVFAGPSFLKATQSLLYTVNPAAKTYTSQQRETDRVKGFNIGLDASWMFAKYFGVGVGLRYSRAFADVIFIGDTVPLQLGGYHMGLGARARF